MIPEGLQAEEVIVDGTTYAIAPMPAMEAIDFLPRLAEVLGPGMAQFKNISDVTQDGGAAMAIIGDALSAIAVKLPAGALKMIIGKLLWNITRDAKSVSPGPGFNAEFARRPAAVFQLLAHAFRINYADFYEAVSGAIQSAVASLRQRDSASSTAESSTSPTAGLATS